MGSHQSVFIYSLEEGAAVCRYVTPIDCLLLGRAHVSVIFCCDETPRPKHFLKEESVYLTHTPSPCSQQVEAGTPAGRNLEAGAEAEAMEECSLAECSRGLLSFFSPTSYNHVPRDGSAHMAGLSLIHHQSRHCPTVLSPGQCYGSIIPIQVPCSQMTLPCVKLTQKQTGSSHSLELSEAVSSQRRPAQDWAH